MTDREEERHYKRFALVDPRLLSKFRAPTDVAKTLVGGVVPTSGALASTTYSPHVQHEHHPAFSTATDATSAVTTTAGYPSPPTPPPPSLLLPPPLPPPTTKPNMAYYRK